MNVRDSIYNMEGFMNIWDDPSEGENTQCIMYRSSERE